MRAIGLICVIAAAGTVAAPAAAQDPAAGERVFIQCRACHQVGETAKNALPEDVNAPASAQAS